MEVDLKGVKVVICDCRWPNVKKFQLENEVRFGWVQLNCGYRTQFNWTQPNLTSFSCWNFFTFGQRPSQLTTFTPLGLLPSLSVVIVRIGQASKPYYLEPVHLNQSIWNHSTCQTYQLWVGLFVVSTNWKESDCRRRGVLRRGIVHSWPWGWGVFIQSSNLPGGSNETQSEWQHELHLVALQHLTL